MSKPAMSMIETATRAFVAKLSGDRLVPWVDDEAGLSSVVLDGQFDLLEAMRAAIAALREPTDYMISEGWYAANAENAADTWRDMIDAALAEPTTGE